MKLYFFLVLATVLISGCFSEPPPTDQELIQIFNDNKQVFIQLQNQIYKDGYKVVSLDPEWSDPDEIPLEVKKQYYKLFKQVQVTQILKRGKDTLVFSVWATGNATGGNYKGYIFKPDMDSNWPHEEKQSLDNPISKGEYFYKHKINDDWYLFYEHFD